jgi:hypothetical protein
VRDAKARAALDLRQQTSRIDDRADVAHGQKIHQCRLARFDVDLNLCKANDE